MIEVDIFMSESGEVVVGEVLELEDTLLKSICPEDSIKLVADASTRTGHCNAAQMEDFGPSVTVASPESGAPLKLTEPRFRPCASIVPFLPSGLVICIVDFRGTHVEFC